MQLKHVVGLQYIISDIYNSKLLQPRTLQFGMH